MAEVGSIDQEDGFIVVVVVVGSTGVSAAAAAGSIAGKHPGSVPCLRKLRS